MHDSTAPWETHLHEFAFPKQSSSAVRWVAVGPFRSPACSKKAIIFHPKASACARRRYSLWIFCALEQDVPSVLFSLRFQDVDNMLSFSWGKKGQRILCVEIYNANVICCVFLSRFWYGLPRKRVMRWGSVLVNFKTIQISPLKSIIIIYKDACLVHFARDPGK